MGWIRKTRNVLISSVAVALIITAVSFTLLRTMLPYATGYIAEIESVISSQIGLPVSIGSLDAEMHWFAPRLKVLDLVIYKDNGQDELINLKEANVALAFFDSIRYLMPVAGTVSLHGAELIIERHPNGKWVIQGFELYERESSKDSEELIALILSADVELIDSRIHWRDYTGGSRDIDFEDASVQLENELGRQYLKIDVRLPPDLGERFAIVAQLTGDLRDLRNLEAELYVNGKGLVFDNWVDTTRIKEFVKGGCKLDIEFWTHIEDARLTRVASHVNASNLVLTNRDDPRKVWRANSLRTKAFWRALDQGWRLDVRELNLQIADSSWQDNVDIVVANDGDDWRILASYLKPADILPVLDVVPDSIDLSVLNAYQSYLSAGEFANFAAVLTASEKPDLQLNTEFNDVSIALADHGISVTGLDGEVRVDGDTAELIVESKDVVADTGDLLRWPLQLDRISGKLDVQLDQHGVRLQTPALIVENRHIQTVTRLSTEISTDKQIFLDVQSNFANGLGEHAHKYLPATILPEGLLGWLDNAFIAGYVPSGSFLFRGMIDEYPFDDNQGKMQALFQVEDGTLHFLDGWPQVHNASATVRFDNAALCIENAQSHEDNGSRAQLDACIPDLRNALLSLDVMIDAPAAEMQQYVWNSGLDRILGRTIDHFQVNGQTETSLAIDVPLGKKRKVDEQIQVSGSITMKDNELFFPATGHQLTNINGTLLFSMASLYGESISGQFDSQPVRIDVSTEGEGDALQTQFHLQGRAAIAALVKRFDWGDTAMFEGQPFWDVVIKVPHRAKDYDLMLKASSDLQGLKVGVSDIISKRAYKKLPVTIDYRRLGDAESLDIVSGDVLDLKATIDEDRFWRLDVDSPVVRGKARIHADLDLDSTATFALQSLNLTAFMPPENAPSREWKLKASEIPSLRASIERFQWNDWKLKGVAFEADRHPRGMVVSNITIDDPHLQVSGKGSWLRRSWRLDEETTFSFSLSSGNLGDTLERLGYARYVDQSNMQAALHWHWPGAPYRFDWESLSGSTSVELSRGIITDIDPGAGGRFLGLFNLLHLPKRLGLDFADVYKKGFVFDSVKGSYVFGSGDAVTQDTQISASAADLTMIGRIGVADQDYDLVTIVRPHSSVATFAGGTLVGGPTVGVGLAILQEIFGLNLLGKDIYTIKGSWNDPVIAQISSEQDQATEDASDDFDDY